jgi:hypothetical protein
MKRAVGFLVVAVLIGGAVWIGKIRFRSVSSPSLRSTARWALAWLGAASSAARGKVNEIGVKSRGRRPEDDGDG